MLEPSKIQEAKRLLAEGKLSHRQIAKWSASAGPRWARSPRASDRTTKRGRLRAAGRTGRALGALRRMRRHGLYALSAVPRAQAKEARARSACGCCAAGAHSLALQRLLAAVRKANRRARGGHARPTATRRPTSAAARRTANSGTNRALPAAPGFPTAARASAIGGEGWICSISSRATVVF